MSDEDKAKKGRIDLPLEEREFHLLQTADDHGTFYADTNDPYWIRRLERAGAEFIKEIGYHTRLYKLVKGQVTIRKKHVSRKLTDDERSEIGERLLKAREETQEDE